MQLSKSGIPIFVAACIWPVAPLCAEDGQLRIYVENDFFDVIGKHSDRYYTQGLRIEYSKRARAGLESDFLFSVPNRAWCNLLCGEIYGEPNVRSGIAGGQNIYTPNDIGIARNQPYQRPWAAHAYLSRFATVAYHTQEPGWERQDRLETSLGVVGPLAFGDFAQTEWHRLNHWPLPQGWHNQLRNEPVVQVQYETSRRWVPPKTKAIDLIPRLRFNAGNALTSAEADVTLRFGRNLQGFGITPAPLAPPPSAMAAVDSGDAPVAAETLRPSRKEGSFNVFVRGNVKAVARNLFIQGNTFRDQDIRVRKKTIVPELSAGFEARAWRNVWFSYQYIHRWPEFEDVRGRSADPHDFGAVTLTFR